ncbi:MAG TPA: homoserine kinase [Bacteroidota bacterium]|nr:homoserine kinase [Bacteroidota bacterium]
MSSRTIKAYAPASISNLGPGFDVLGLAIEKPGDVAIATRQKEAGLTFKLRGTVNNVPDNAQDNVAAYVSSLLIEEVKPLFGIRLTLDKRMPIGSGLGSSAASSVAALVAVNALLGSPLRKEELLPFALEGEKKIAGSGHADNVAPSLLGGAVVVRSYDPLDVVKIPIRNAIYWVVVHPHLVIPTAEARKLVPQTVPISSAIRQWGNVGGLVAGLAAGSAAMVGKCVEDVIVEPVRATLIPGFYEVKRAALDAGATGCSISGSGPAMFAVAKSPSSARAIGAAMKAAFQRAAGISSDVYISRVNMKGAKVLKEQ